MSAEPYAGVAVSTALFTQNAEAVSGSLYLFTHNAEAVSGSLYLFTHNAEAVSGSLYLFTHNAEAVSGSLYLFTHNAEAVSGSLYLFTHNAEAVSGSLYLFTHNTEAGSLYGTIYTQCSKVLHQQRKTALKLRRGGKKDLNPYALSPSVLLQLSIYCHRVHNGTYKLLWDPAGIGTQADHRPTRCVSQVWVEPLLVQGVQVNCLEV